LKRILFSSMTAAALALAVAAPAQASEALAKSNGCLACHAVGSKKVGPSLKAVAAGWKKNNTGADKAVAAIKAKHDGLKASDADLKAIASWIATL
jgi:cytochrome c